MPAYGWWGLDPGSVVAFPGALTEPPSGKVTSTPFVPADPALRGLDMFVQAVACDVATSNSIRLTAWTGGELTGRYLQDLWVVRFGDDSHALRTLVVFTGDVATAILLYRL